MGISEYVAIVLSVIGLISGFIVVWINLNLKIKELEVKILNVEMEQNSINKRIEKNESISREDHKLFDEKLDKIMELLTKLLAEHNFINCNEKKENKR